MKQTEKITITAEPGTFIYCPIHIDVGWDRRRVSEKPVGFEEARTFFCGCTWITTDFEHWTLKEQTDGFT